MLTYFSCQWESDSSSVLKLRAFGSSACDIEMESVLDQIKLQDLPDPLLTSYISKASSKCLREPGPWRAIALPMYTQRALALVRLGSGTMERHPKSLRRCGRLIYSLLGKRKRTGAQRNSWVKYSGAQERLVGGFLGLPLGDLVRGTKSYSLCLCFHSWESI